MPSFRRLQLRETLVACIAIRLLLGTFISPSWISHGPGLLSVSSPLTSFESLKEGLWLYQNGMKGIYEGGVFRHSPLYIPVNYLRLPFLFNLFGEDFLSAALYTGVDVFAAYALVRIWTARQRKQTLSSESTESKSSLLIIIYTLNPLIILPSLARSTSSVDNAVLLTAICLACEWSTSEVASPAHKETEVSSPSLTDKVDQATPPFALGALFFLALRTHLSIDALILVPPMFMLIFSSPASRLRRPGPFKYAQKYDRPYSFLRQDFVEISLFILLWTALAAYARTCAGDWKWVWQTWGASLTLPSLTPNPGVWWYFFTEMFDHFRPFFLMVFSLHLLLYVAPICIKFQHDPLYSIFILIGILATLKPYPTLSDHGLFVGMWVVMSEVHPYLRHPLPTLLTLLHSSLLQPLFAHLWLTHGTGNANFYYASTLVGACAGGLGIVDSIWAGLRIAVEKGESRNEALEEKEVVTQQ